MATISKKSGRIKTILELEPEEVIALYCVLYSAVGGSPTNSARKYLDRISFIIGETYPTLKKKYSIGEEYFSGNGLFDSLGFGVSYKNETDKTFEKLADSLIK